MILVDTALRQREQSGQPIRVGLLGAGFMARGIIRQIMTTVPGMIVVAVANRSVDRAVRALAAVDGIATPVVETADRFERTIRQHGRVVTADPALLCASPQVDVIIDATGAIEYGARTTLLAFDEGKPVVSMNAELDATVGPELQRRATQAGVLFTAADGDQPGVQMNLLRFVRSIGLTPRVCGNIKGLQDPYRTPTTQQAFAERWGQNAHMVTSFADGTKISFEQTIVANATGMSIESRGMRGAAHPGHIDSLTSAYDIDQLRTCGGVVDYVVGAQPGPGVFVLASHDDPIQQHYLQLYKLGEGPLYAFYTPYHLCHFEVPLSAARALLFGDAVLQARMAAPSIDVVATAKRDLKAGDVLDGLGGYMTYGQCERHDVVRQQQLLPMGLAEGCRLTRDLSRDTVLSMADITRPPGRLIDELRMSQDTHYPVAQHTP
ncbi:MAG: SAF domain-containing protein [Abyssibacter sp.]|uniref:NAD(P)H-dependent oxidoreductase n=1 Tax=Abyssibacter sp. TaxID=2320200 RepID=UPI00321BB4DA